MIPSAAAAAASSVIARCSRAAAAISVTDLARNRPAAAAHSTGARRRAPLAVRRLVLLGRLLCRYLVQVQKSHDLLLPQVGSRNSMSAGGKQARKFLLCANLIN